MIPLPAELVVRHDDQGVAGLGTALDGLDQVDQVIGAVRLARVAGMLVLVAEGLDEADLRQGAVLRRGEERDLVLEVRGAVGCARGIAREVVERLMVELERRVRAEREGLPVGDGHVRVRAGRPGAIGPARSVRVAGRVVPAAGVPRPADPGVAHPVADVQRGRGVVRGRLRGAEAALRLPRRLQGVDGPVAAREAGDGAGARLRDVPVDDRAGRLVQGVAARGREAGMREPVRVEHRVLAGRGTRPQERLGGDQVLVVEVRAAERGLEELIGDDVLRGAIGVEVRVDRQGRRVVVAHRHANRIAAGHVAILLAAVELVLLLIELVDQVPGAASGQAGRRHAVGPQPADPDPVAEAELLVRPGTRHGVGGDVLVDVERRVQEVARVGRRRRGGVRERDRLRVAGRLLRERVGRERRRGGRRRPAAREVGVQVDVELLEARVGAQPDQVLAVHVAPQPVEVVEAVVLLVDHDDVLEVAEWSLVCGDGRAGRHETDRDEGR